MDFGRRHEVRAGSALLWLRLIPLRWVRKNSAMNVL